MMRSPETNDLETSPAAVPVAEGKPKTEKSIARRENWRLIRRKPGFVIGAVISAIWVLCGLFPNQIAPFDPLNYRVDNNQSPSWTNLFGTDRGGRDVFSRVIAGATDVAEWRANYRTPLMSLMELGSCIIAKH